MEKDRTRKRKEKQKRKTQPEKFSKLTKEQDPKTKKKRNLKFSAT